MHTCILATGYTSARPRRIAIASCDSSPHESQIATNKLIASFTQTNFVTTSLKPRDLKNCHLLVTSGLLGVNRHYATFYKSSASAEISDRVELQ